MPFNSLFIFGAIPVETDPGTCVAHGMAGRDLIVLRGSEGEGITECFGGESRLTTDLSCACALLGRKK